MVWIILKFGYGFIILNFSKFYILVMALLTLVLAMAVNAPGKNSNI